MLLFGYNTVFIIDFDFDGNVLLNLSNPFLNSVRLTPYNYKVNSVFLEKRRGRVKIPCFIDKNNSKYIVIAKQLHMSV